MKQNEKSAAYKALSVGIFDIKRKNTNALNKILNKKREMT
jgi:hypothetical protein